MSEIEQDGNIVKAARALYPRPEGRGFTASTDTYLMQTMRRYLDILREADPAPRVVRDVSPNDAEEMLHTAFFGGKNKGLMPRRFHRAREDHVLVDLPLEWVQPNEDGENYDGTVQPDLARAYAKEKIDTPVDLRFGPRNADERHHAWVSDGGHRVSAARMRGDSHIRAIMPKSHFERLLAKRR